MRTVIEKKINCVFIVESNNDLDMIVPLIWKFSTDKLANVIIVNTSPGVIKANDPRILFVLKNSSVKYIEISKDFKFLDDISSYIYSKMKIGFFHRRYLNSLLKYSQKKFEKIPILKNFPTAVFVSYFLDHNAVKGALKWAKKYKFIKVFNNHGITPFVVDSNSENHSIAPSFDVCILTKSSEKNLPKFNNKKTKKIYAAPRFSKEWCNKLSEVYSEKSLNFKKKKFRPVFMLSKWLEKDDKETIISAIKIVSEMEDTEVLVKPHTRGMILEESLPSNVKILNNEHHSRKIIQESDAIIFTRSSIFLDAIILHKPVIHLSYATNTDLASEALNCCKTHDHHELVIKLNAIKLNKTIYNSEQRKKCINFYAGENYHNMLDNIFDEIKLTVKELNK